MVVKYPHKALQEISSEVQIFDDLLKFIANGMIDEMYILNGVGLAAPQVGINKRLIVVDHTSGSNSNSCLTLVNPEIIKRSGTINSVEGCLSLPGIQVTVPRAERITVKYRNILGETKELETSGMQAIIIQHEIDHLNGILIIDRAKEHKNEIIKN